MEFTPRIRQILTILLDAGEPVPEQKIADAAGVSKRTIQREIDYLGSELSHYHLELKKKKNAGVFVEGELVELQKLRDDLSKSKASGVADKMLRRKYLTAELLRERTPKKLFYFSEKFGVSEATISKDLDAVQEWLLENGIQMIRKPGYGIVLEHSEKNYRKAIQRFVNENVGNEDIRTLVSSHKEAANILGSFHNGNIYELLNSEVLGRVSRVFQELDEPRLKQMTDESYIGLMLHITIAIDRILKGEVITGEDEKLPEYEKDEDYALARSIIRQLEEEFSLKIPQNETGYILLHIRGSKVNYSGQTRLTYKIGVEETLNLIDRMLDAYDNTLACELTCDEEFIHGLMMHLEPAMVRLKNDMSIYNPLLDEIKKEYPDVFEKCKKAAAVITENTGLQVPETEIGFLVMHFGAAEERIGERRIITRTVEIGVVCASGFGVARLMMTKLKGSLSRNVNIRTYGKDEITPYVISRTDFFVTSFTLEGDQIDYLKVSPLITRDDLLLIQAKADEYSHMPRAFEESDFTRQLEQLNALSGKIRFLIRNYKNLYEPEEVSLEVLLETAAVQITGSARRAALLKADLLAREKIMTQIFAGMEFALFHTRTKAVSDAVFYTVTPQQAKRFTDPSLKGIRAAVIMLMPDGTKEEQETDKEMLGHISSAFVEDEPFLHTIFTADEACIREQLQKVLKAYFNEYIARING